MSIYRIVVEFLYVFFLIVIFPTQTWANQINEIKLESKQDNQKILAVSFDTTSPEPAIFTQTNPYRIVLDFSQVIVSQNFDVKKFYEKLSESAVKVRVISNKEKVRVVITTKNLFSYKLLQHDKLTELLMSPDSSTETSAVKANSENSGIVQGVDFRRGEGGAGIIAISLTKTNVNVDTKQKGGRIDILIKNQQIANQFIRRLDVLDFATPVKYVDMKQKDKDVLIAINTMVGAEHMVYQTDKLFTIEVRALEQKEKKISDLYRKSYHGDKLSLKFQDVEVRSVLQLLADFTKINIVASDSVKGKLTLRLDNVPWDQALDIILRAKGLAMRKENNVIMIAPTGEMAAQEKLDLEAINQKEELIPLRSEFMQINYAKAKDIATMLKSEKNSLLSSRGNVSIDERTNTLLIQDTLEKIEQIRSIISQLDTAVRQVEIEARIVIASKKFTNDLGVKWGSLTNASWNKTHILAGGDITSTNSLTNTGSEPSGRTINDRLNVNLPAANVAGRLALSLARLGKMSFLDLELSAAESENLSHVIASPKLITSNDKEATIKQGKQVPYQEASSSGATSTSFKDAVMELKVTPHITPDDRVIMDLSVKDDEVDANAASGTSATSNAPPSINTKEMMTQVLVDNGETIVLGGIYQRKKSNLKSKVPFFGDIPVVSVLFSNSNDADERDELLIFVTPRIVMPLKYADNN